jgi:hypothetical protein
MSKNTQILKYFGVSFLSVLLISSINSIENLLTSIGYYVIVLWLSWQLTKLFRSYYCTEKVDPNRKAVLITGSLTVLVSLSLLIKFFILTYALFFITY